MQIISLEPREECRDLLLPFLLLWERIYYPLCFLGGASGKEPACQGRRHKRHGFDPWVRKILWRRKWQPTLVFLPGESSWTEGPGGLYSIGSQRIRHN